MLMGFPYGTNGWEELPTPRWRGVMMEIYNINIAIYWGELTFRWSIKNVLKMDFSRWEVMSKF